MTTPSPRWSAALRRVSVKSLQLAFHYLLGSYVVTHCLGRKCVSVMCSWCDLGIGCVRKLKVRTSGSVSHWRFMAILQSSHSQPPRDIDQFIGIKRKVSPNTKRFQLYKQQCIYKFFYFSLLLSFLIGTITSYYWGNDNKSLWAEFSCCDVFL